MDTSIIINIRLWYQQLFAKNLDFNEWNVGIP